MTDIFSKVIFLGPTKKGKGGMASVMKSYSEQFRSAKLVSTNSIHNSVVSAIVTIFALIKLLYYRLFSKREILHIHFASGRSFIRKSIFIKLGKNSGYKVVGHCHGGMFKDYVLQKGEKKIVHILEKCDYIVALSNSWDNYFKHELKLNTNIIVVKNPISNPNLKKVQLGKRSSTLSLLFMGTIVNYKGIFELLETIALHKDFFKDKIKLHIGGNGNVSLLKSEIERYQIEDIVIFEGYIQGENKDRLLSECDVFALPSHIEGLPICILEAMANGCGIVSTTVGGIPEIVEDGVNGFLIEPGDKDALFNAIKKYIDNPDLIAKHGKVSLKKVEPYYIENVQKQLVEVYTKLLEN